MRRRIFLRTAQAPAGIFRLGSFLTCLWLAGAAAAQPDTSGPSWNELSPAEQHVLEPLRTHWTNIDPARKAKWREVAGRYRSLSPDAQQRLRARMVDWDGMSAAQRTEARTRFKESKQLPASERQARWEAYKSLSPEQRRELAARAATRPQQSGRLHPGRSRTESNRQPPAKLLQPKPVTPGIIQARPGVSTRPILQDPVPPRHQQPGLPKIAATPEFVNSTTLLPQRGPQGAAAQPKQRRRDRDRRE